MPASSNVILYRYSPATLDRETLQYLLVGRQKLAESLLEEIDQASGSGTPRFFLLVGPRGIGKSHLMTLLYQRMHDDLAERIIPVKLAEEEYSIFRASDFFLRILEEMGIGIADVIALEEDRLVRDVAVDMLKEIASTEGKQIAIFVENLHELFKQMDKREIQALRSIFQQTNTFSVVASAPSVFPGVSDHDEPFYNFFRIFHLQELKCAEVKELMKRVAQVDGNTTFIENFQDYEPTIEALFYLIGGNPRLVILLYETISKGRIDDAGKIFFEMTDEQTPYYQEVFQRLTGQRRLIFDTVLGAETPLTPKEIAERSRLDPATVNAQLRRLERDGYVISHPMGRRTSYEARERLLGLWRAMRRSPGRSRVFRFIEFLRDWYSPDERTVVLDRECRELSGVAEGENQMVAIASYIATGKRNEALVAIENVEGPFADLDQLMQFVHLCLTLAGEELLDGNRTNGLRLIDIAYTQAGRLEPDLVKKITVDFLKWIIGEGEIPAIKSAVDEIIRLRGTEFQWFLKPVADAVEIVETNDMKLYSMRMQPEEREIVAGIVQRITGAEELVPGL